MRTFLLTGAAASVALIIVAVRDLRAVLRTPWGARAFGVTIGGRR